MRRLLLMILPLAISLAACAPATATSPIAPTATIAPPSIATPTDDPALIPTLFPNTEAGGDLKRIDEQGMVVVEITPTNLGTGSDTLNFDVAMNTHSVSLGMDLAALATLTADTGVSIQASKWEAPPGGGHHVSGTLIFPAYKDGKSILDGAGKITLTIVDIDAPSRIFEWELK